MGVSKARLAEYSAALLATIAVVWTGVNVRHEYLRPHPRPTSATAIVEEWRSLASVGERRGRDSARVTIVVFSDYQCGSCREMEKKIGVLQRKHRDALAVVTRHFPLPTHPYAAPAARAVICASYQGQFESLHHLLFSTEGDSLGSKAWVEYAAAAGISDTASFGRCIEKPEVADRVNADRQAAEWLGGFATPTFLINEELYVGLPWDFERIVAKHVKR